VLVGCMAAWGQWEGRRSVLLIPLPVVPTLPPATMVDQGGCLLQVLMATNRPDTLDPALLRPGRLDRKVEFGLPDLESRTQIFQIHTRTMNCERDIRFELLARLCPNSTGADIRSVCTEAGMYAIRARRKTVTEKDFLDAVNKVIKGYQKFSATPKYMVYN
jgi:26S proteasome regulatory subunit T1